MAAFVWVPDSVIKTHMAEATAPMMQTLVDEIAQDAQDLAPVRTGALRDSIHGDVVEDSPVEVRGRVSADVDYAAYVELGTYKMVAQPYLQPALYKERTL